MLDELQVAENFAFFEAVLVFILYGDPIQNAVSRWYTLGLQVTAHTEALSVGGDFSG